MGERVQRVQRLQRAGHLRRQLRAGGGLAPGEGSPLRRVRQLRRHHEQRAAGQTWPGSGPVLSGGGVVQLALSTVLNI